MTHSLLKPVNDGVVMLHDDQGLHVGHFKWIQGQWKFKAIGYGPSGELLPGGGPLTHRHNTVLTQLDEALIRAQILEA